MSKTNVFRCVPILASLLVLNSNVHAVQYIDSPHKYVVGGEDVFKSTYEMRAHPERSKLFTLKGVFYPRNEAAMKDFGGEIKVAGSAVTKEQQDIEVIAKNVKWAARVNQGNVEGAKCSWVGPDNEEKVQAFKSRSTKTKEVVIPAHIKSMILQIYRNCVTQSEALEDPSVNNSFGYERFKIIREFD